MAAGTETIGSILGIIDELLELLNKKKSKDQRNNEKDKVHERIMDITDVLFKMNLLNAQLPPDNEEVKRIKEAMEEWEHFKEHFKKFVEFHKDDKDEKAKDQLSQSKVYLRKLREILENISLEKQIKLRLLLMAEKEKKAKSKAKDSDSKTAKNRK